MIETLLSNTVKDHQTRLYSVLVRQQKSEHVNASPEPGDGTKFVLDFMDIISSTLRPIQSGSPILLHALQLFVPRLQDEDCVRSEGRAYFRSRKLKYEDGHYM